MRNVSGGNAAETRMIKAVQSAVCAIPDGSIGTQTMSDIAVKLGADCFPLGISIYSQPVIIAKDIRPVSSKDSPLSMYDNAISGSFNDGGAPCSILVVDGFVEQGTSCHYWDDRSPESVLYRRVDGSIHISRMRTVDDLADVMWAVGGMGLLDYYDPAAEGFKGKFSDVLRRTAHTMLGVKNGMCYLVYCSDMTAIQVNNFAKKLGLEKAIMLDGGHLAAINSESTRINCNQRQLYVIEAV